MNILFVHEVDLLNKVVFEIHNLAEILSKNHNVFAIDYEESWKRKNIFDPGTLRTQEFKNVSRAYNGRGFTLRRPGMIKFPLLSRLSAFFTHDREIENIIKNEKIDAIILYSAPTNGLQTIYLAKKYNIPVIFRSIDVLNRLVPNWFLRAPTRIFEKKVYENANRIVAITPKLSDYVINLGASKDRVELLFTGVDTNQFNPKVNSTKLRKILNLNNDCKVIVFIGTLFEFCGMDRYIEQFPEILKEFPETKLIVVGGGSLHEKLKQLVRDLNLEDSVILTGFQPYEMMPQYINLADICINPFQINDTTRDIMPGKILQYLACGKPVIATPLPGMRAVIPDEEKGVIYSEIDKFGRSTIELLRDEERITTEQIRFAIELTHKGRIQSVSYFMLGYPWEMPETIRETIDFTKSSQLYFAQISLMIPFPCTEIYELYMKSGHVTSNWDDYIYVSLKSASTPVFESGMLSKEELQAWNGRAYKEFYFRSSYMWQRLIGMRSFGDLNTNIRGFSMFMEMMRE